MRLPANQPCVPSISDCGKMQSATEFMARKILTSSVNGTYFECLITLLSSLISILENKSPKTDPRGTRERTSKDN